MHQQRLLAKPNQLSASQQLQDTTDSFGGFGDLEQPGDQLEQQLQGAGDSDAHQQGAGGEQGAGAAGVAGSDADVLDAGLLHSPTPSGSGEDTGEQLGLRQRVTNLAVC
jgi:hypothetical protein